MKGIAFGDQHLSGCRVISTNDNGVPAKVVFLSAKIKIREEPHISPNHDRLSGSQHLDQCLTGFAAACGTVNFDLHSCPLPGDHFHT